MLPASYTLDTFEDYLKYEVLQDTAFSLGWAVDIPLTPVTWIVTLISVDAGAKAIRVSALKFPIPKGTTLQFRHRLTNDLFGTVVTQQDGFEGNEVLFVDIALGTVTASVVYRATTITAEIPPAEPVFQPIITDTLASLGVADITTMTGDKLNELRVRGRLELWHKVMGFTSFDYPYSTQDSKLDRDGVYFNALNMYNMSLLEWNQMTQVVDVEVTASEKAKVKVVW